MRSGGGAGDTGKLTSGSQNNLKSEYEGDLWKSVEENIKNILANYGKNSPGISEAAPEASPSDDGLGEVLGETLRVQPGAEVPTAAGKATAPPPPPKPTNKDKSPKVKSEGADAFDIIPSGASILSVNNASTARLQNI